MEKVEKAGKKETIGRKYLVDDDLPLDKKAEIWVGRHFKHIFIFAVGISFISLLLSFFLVLRMEGTVIRQSEIIKNISSKVVLVSPDGRVAVMEKQDISNPAMKNYLRDFLRNVIISGFDYRDAGVGSEKDVLKVEKVKNVISYFEEEAKNNFVTYLAYLYRLYQADKLPEIVYVSGIPEKEEEFVMQGNKFIYNVSPDVSVFFVLAGKWWKVQDKVVISMKGKFDVSRADLSNPFGLTIENFEVKVYPEKRIKM